MTRAAVFGNGSWGTAFAMVMADAGCEVSLWGRRAALAETINTTRTNPDYLPGVELPKGITATADAAEVSSASGRSATRLANRPTSRPQAEVSIAATIRVTARICRVWPRSSRG